MTHKTLLVAAGFLGLVAIDKPAFAQEYGLIGESTNNYSFCGATNLPNSYTNVSNFLNGMSPAGGISWSVWANWTDPDFWDRDLYDSDLTGGVGDDEVAIDPRGGAIGYINAHGFCGDWQPFFNATSPQSCSSSSDCTSPGTGGTQSAPGFCTQGPNRAHGSCIYDELKGIAVCGSNDAYGGTTYYSTGQTALGETPSSGDWRGAGLNGNIKFLVIDSSCTVRPGLEPNELGPAYAGIHNIGVVMPTTWDADAVNVPDRGAKFAARFRSNPNASIGYSWIYVLNDLSASEGSSCNGTSSGGHGIHGCGANFVSAAAISQYWAQWTNGTESWIGTQNDGEAVQSGFGYMAWIYQCNYDCSTYPIVKP